MLSLCACLYIVHVAFEKEPARVRTVKADNSIDFYIWLDFLPSFLWGFAGDRFLKETRTVTRKYKDSS